MEACAKMEAKCVVLNCAVLKCAVYLRCFGLGARRADGTVLTLPMRRVVGPEALIQGLHRRWRAKVPNQQCDRQRRRGSTIVAVGAVVGLASARRIDARHALF